MSQRGLGEAAEMAFRGAGEALNDLLAEDRPPDADPDDIWLPTDEEAEGVGKPVGRIIARRIPDLPAEDASDAADLIAAAIPFGIWAIRGLAATIPRVVRERRARRGAVILQEQGATSQ